MIGFGDEMNHDYIAEQIRMIEEAAEEGRDVAATTLERDLWFAVMSHVATKRDDRYGYCDAALATTMIDFYRGGAI